MAKLEGRNKCGEQPDAPLIPFLRFVIRTSSFELDSSFEFRISYFPLDSSFEFRISSFKDYFPQHFVPWVVLVEEIGNNQG
jgi:hypothetical protein